MTPAQLARRQEQNRVQLERKREIERRRRRRDRARFNRMVEKGRSDTYRPRRPTVLETTYMEANATDRIPRKLRRSLRVGAPEPEPVVVSDAVREQYEKFLEEECFRSSERIVRVRPSILHAAFLNWCERRGIAPLMPKITFHRLGRSMFAKGASHGRGMLVGVALLPEKG